MLSKSMPAVWQAFDNTVCPSASPASAAVSKVAKGWNGLRFSEARSAACHHKAVIKIGIVRHHNGAVTAARFNTFTYNFKKFRAAPRIR